MKRLTLGLATLLVVVTIGVAAAQTPPPAPAATPAPATGKPAEATPAAPAAATPAPPSKIDKGDTAWMLTSSALVLHDDGARPGPLLRRHGPPEERARHPDAELHHHGASSRSSGCCAATAWRSGRTRAASSAASTGSACAGVGPEPYADYAATIPHQVFMLFQLMFAIITPALITGAFAERMKFSAYLLFIAALGHVRLRPARPLGLGRRRLAEEAGRARLRRRHGRAHLLGRRGAGLRDRARQAQGLRAAADAAAQPAA